MAAPSKVQMLAQSQSKAALAGQPSAVVLDGEGLQSVTEIVGSKSKITALQADPKREKRKKKKRDKKRQHAFEIPGVKKMTLSELAQKIIGCTAGDTVTSEKPWIYVDKELLVDNLELHEESSEFLPLKGELLKYPRKELLVGYIPDESRDYDEFYICLTEEATDIVNDVIEKMKAEQEERLYNSVNKAVGEWIPQGTEEEVDDGIMKNSRPLIEVEVETKYPIFPNKIEFRTVPAEQRRDGYMELRCADESIVNVYKRRIDACVQVAPQVISAEAQTNCTYPTNSTTEYLYEIAGDPVKIMERCTPGIVKYAENNMDNVSDMLTVNSVINLYTDDYRALCADPSAKKAKATALETVTENMLFMDVNMCKGKMVADAAWHPMWTGTVAIAYANFAPNVYLSGQNTDDLVHKAVFDSNPVLMWSTKDVLRPKLILESPREAFKLSFCAFDENILVGGLKNGQIIIWDIRNKLTKVEELEVLTANQQKYRAHMNSLMGWMKDIHDLALVRPTALSDLKHSHKSAITGITWMSPYHEYSRLGKLDEIPEEEERFSMQFLTCSKDGTICIWDLLKKPKVQPGGFKIKKLKRLKKKPSALLVDVSPFKILHMNLRPIYRLRVPRGEEKTKIVAMAGCTENYFRMRYVEKNPVRGRKISIEDRIYYKPVLHFEDTAKEPEPELYIGSMEGDCAHLSWEGQDFESGEVVNSQLCKILNVAKYHDGPVCVIKKCPETDAILTVGGKTFAIWRDDFKGRPVLWRRGGHMYTAGDWNPFQPYTLKMQLMNGDVESWIVFSSSKSPMTRLTYSSEYLTLSTVHPRRLKRNIYAAADKQGVFRLYDLHEDILSGTIESKTKQFNHFIDREIQRKLEFAAWQAEWNHKFASWIQAREEAAREAARLEEEAKKEKEAQLLEEQEVVEKPKVAQPGEFIELIKQRRQHELEANIRKTIITKKQLNTREIEKRRKPLQKLEEENEQKKRKQKKRLKEGATIFTDTVAMLFPEVVREKPIPPPDPYAGGDTPEELLSCYMEYPVVAKEAEDHVYGHPYHYEFDWKKMIATGVERKKRLEPYTQGHYERHRQRKLQRELAQLGMHQPPPEPPKVVLPPEDEDDDYPFVSEATETEPE